jgi:hypothetical protein
MRKSRAHVSLPHVKNSLDIFRERGIDSITIGKLSACKLRILTLEPHEAGSNGIEAVTEPMKKLPVLNTIKKARILIPTFIKERECH